MNLIVGELTRALPAEIFVYFAVFVRISAAMLGMPGLGELAIPARMRLSLALAICLVLTPLVGPSIPPLPAPAIGLGSRAGRSVDRPPSPWAASGHPRWTWPASRRSFR